MYQYEREEQAIHDAYERGEISAKELNAELRELQRDYQGQAEAAAQEAYENTLNDWFGF